MQSPTIEYLNAAKNLLRYLGGSKDLAICYSPTKKDIVNTLLEGANSL
jgi:hypothetical protein